MIIVFSLGMLLYELLALEMPFNDLKIFEVPNAITRGDKPKLPELGDEYSPLIDIHNDCIQLDPSLRPSTKDLASKIKDADLVLSAVPGFLGFETLKNIILQRKNTVDISFFPENALELNQLALENNVTSQFQHMHMPPLFEEIISD